MSQMNMAMKHRKNSYLEIPNQNNRSSQSACQVSQTDIVIKHKKNHYIRILNQDKSIVMTSISMSQMNTISEHASNDIGNSQCAIKR